MVGKHFSVHKMFEREKCVRMLGMCSLDEEWPKRR